MRLSRSLWPIAALLLLTLSTAQAMERFQYLQLVPRRLRVEIGQRVKNKDGGYGVALARGIRRPDQLREILQRTTNPEVAPPDEASVKAYVAEQTLPGPGKLVEFTSHAQTALSFGSNCIVISILVDEKYLAQGSVSEAGHLLWAEAPYEVSPEFLFASQVQQMKVGADKRIDVEATLKLLADLQKKRPSACPAEQDRN